MSAPIYDLRIHNRITPLSNSPAVPTHRISTRTGDALSPRYYPIDPRQITYCDPAKISLASISEPPKVPKIKSPVLKETVYVSRARKIAVGVAAGSAAFLTSAVALAGGAGAAPLLGLGGLIGWGLLGVGALSVATLLTSPSRAKKIFAGIVAAASGAVLCATVVPGIMATVGAGGIAGYSLIKIASYLLLGYGLIRLVRTMRKEIQPANYQSPESRVMLANPTPRKLWHTLVKPAWYLTMATGAPVALAGVFSDAVSSLLHIPQGLSYGAITVGGFALVAGFFLTKAIISSVIDGVEFVRDVHVKSLFRLKLRRIGLQKNEMEPRNLLAQISTNFLGNGALCQNLTFTLLLGGIYATQTISMGMSFVSRTKVLLTALLNIVQGNFGLAANNLPALVGLALFSVLFSGASIWAHRTVLLPRAEAGQPHKTHDPLWKSTLKAAGWGAVAGAAIFLLDPRLALANIVVFLANISFGHGFFHSSQTQEMQLHQKNKVFPLFDLRSLWLHVRSRLGDARTVFKVAADVIDPLTSAWVMSLVTEGANWNLNAVSGVFSSNEYRQGQQMIEKLINRDTRTMRRMLQKGYRQMKYHAGKIGALSDPAAIDRAKQEMLNATATALERTAEFLLEAARGNLKTRSGLDFLKDGVLSSGLLGSLLKRGDQDLRVHEQAAQVCRPHLRI